MASGIYQIKNMLNGKCYIGSAVNLQQRWAIHLSILRRNQHYNTHLQRAFDKYGELVFMFSVLEQIEDTEQLIPHEQYYLDALNPEYNIAPTAGSSLGVRHTEEVRIKQTGERNHFYGKHHSVETRAKMSAALAGKRHPNYGKHPSAETRRKMSNAHKREHLSIETRAKLSVAKSGKRHPNYGKHLSEDTKQKISNALRDKHPSVETRRKMSEAKIGHQVSERTRRKISATQMGKRHSAESKRKMSIAKIAYWRRKREEEQEN